ncbi:MAG: hypothetical protein HGB15_09820 [Chlorobaculum sp.]|nr:hypothetical protein [Chlorobaculum sp.]
MAASLSFQGKRYLDDYLESGKLRYGISPDERDERFERVAAGATLRPNRATG